MSVESYEMADLWIRAAESVVFPLAVIAISVCAILYFVYFLRFEKVSKYQKEINKLRKALNESCLKQCEMADAMNGMDDAIREANGRARQQKRRADNMAEIAEGYRQKAS